MAAVGLVSSEPRRAGTVGDVYWYWLKSLCYTVQMSRETPLEPRVSFSNARLEIILVASQPQEISNEDPNFNRSLVVNK